MRVADTEVAVVGFVSSTIVVCLVFGTIQKRLTVEALRTIEGTKTIEVTHIAHGLSEGDSVVITDAASVATIAASDINGTKTIVSVINENTYTITAGGTNNASISTDGGGQPKIASTAATTEWQEQSYSFIRYYPGAITFHENRLWLAGTISQPDGIWASKSGEYFNFDIGSALDNESLDITTNLGDIFTIRHLVSNRDLQIFPQLPNYSYQHLHKNPLHQRTLLFDDKHHLAQVLQDQCLLMEQLYLSIGQVQTFVSFFSPKARPLTQVPVYQLLLAIW